MCYVKKQKITKHFFSEVNWSLIVLSFHAPFQIIFIGFLLYVHVFFSLRAVDSWGQVEPRKAPIFLMLFWLQGGPYTVVGSRYVQSRSTYKKNSFEVILRCLEYILWLIFFYFDFITFQSLYLYVLLLLILNIRGKKYFVQ